jgi:hypothetical protein
MLTKRHISLSEVKRVTVCASHDSLGGDEWSASRSCHFTHGKRAAETRYRARLDAYPGWN